MKTTLFSMALLMAAGPTWAQLPFNAHGVQNLGYAPSGLAAGQLGGDLRLEVVICDTSGNRVAVHAPSGACFVGAPQFLSVGTGPTEVLVSDLDGDGLDDIATRNTTSITVLWQGAAGFTRVDFPAPSGSVPAFEAFDVDGDGDIDLHSGHDWFPNQGGTFGAPIAIGIANPSTPVVAGDFDGDGDIDLAREAGLLGPRFLEVRSNDGAGNFAVSTVLTFSFASGTSFPVVYDQNGDGIDDIAFINTGSANITRILSQTGGAFVIVPTSICVPANCLPLASTVCRGIAWDRDGDGREELIFSRSPQVSGAGLFVLDNPFGTSLSPYFQSSATAVAMLARDFDGDGDVDLITHDAVGTLSVFESNVVAASTALAISLTGGGGQVVSALRSASPLTAQVTNCQGLPAANVPVTLEFEGGFNVGSVTANTNAGGMVVLPMPQPLAAGAWTMTLRAGGSLPITTTIEILPARIEILSGANQSMARLMNAPLPLVMRVLDAFGLPVAGTTLQMPITPIVLGLPTTVVTDAAGQASTSIRGAAQAGPGKLAIKLGVNGPTTAVVDFQVIPAVQLQIVSGEDQVVAPGGTASPIVIEARDAAGTLLAGRAITVHATDANRVVNAGPLTLSTDIVGRAIYTPVLNAATTAAGNGSGPIDVQIAVSPEVWVMKTATIRLETAHASIIGSRRPVGYRGRHPARLTVEVRSPFGSPIPGEIIFLDAPNEVALTSSAVATDANGRATIVADFGPGAPPGRYPIRGAGAITGASFEAEIVLRQFEVWTTSNGSHVVIDYRHEDSSVPILVAVDTPLPAPGFVSSPFGPIVTSLLSPGGGFAALDGLGVFGPADPQLVVGPTWQRAFALPATPLGLTLAIQVYGFDGRLAFN
ncbi:MAG: hypothetical protein KDB53_21590, partial [Planctomycetes bacterium]|nr:hypothetical protein [Planctomycetota bacterium]